MKIYTCALMPFEANESFFTRDSGLLCRSLQEIGVDSKVVMPTRNGGDPSDVIRGTPEELSDPAWWSQLQVDAVVFISWGFKKHTPVLLAARQAGIKTCAIIETCGNSFPYGDFFATVMMFWRKGKFIESFPKRLVGTVGRSMFAFIRGIIDHYHRSVQIAIPHIAAFDTPNGMQRCLEIFKFFPWIQIQSKPLLLGYPIPDHFSPLPLHERRSNIVAIARWDALRHKRPCVLMKTIDAVLRINPSPSFEIFGKFTTTMESWHANLPSELRHRVLLRGVQPSAEISKAIGSSQILYCPSAIDGIPLAVVEGLCGGCSVVGLKTKDVAGLYWAIKEGDGYFARTDSIESHASALILELDAWKLGKRDPIAIAEKWKRWFSAAEVARRTIKLFSGVES